MSQKTEKPTPRRRRQARQKGDVARSQEFSGAAITACVGVALAAWLPTLVHQLIRWTRANTDLATSISRGAHVDLNLSLYHAGLTTLTLLSIPMAVSITAALFFNFLQVGVLFAPNSLLPRLDRVDPGAGLKRLFEPAKLVDAAKNILKLCSLASLASLIIWADVDALSRLARLDISSSLDLSISLASKLALSLGAGLLIFGGIDLIWQRHRHDKKLMMARHEVEREYRESEGDPQIKAQRKQLHRDMLNDPGVDRVRDADVVVVNPTHVAVAIRYDAAVADAPRILSSGRGDIASAIRREARHHDIPLLRHVPLARALVDLGPDAQIPAEFFEPVAEILTHVYSLRTRD